MRKVGRVSRGVAFAVALVASGDVAAQTTVPLSTPDSIALRLAVLHILLDDLGAKAGPIRIWLEPYAELDSQTGLRRRVNLSPGEWAAVAQEFPEARLVATSDSLFLCPSGVRVMMPGSGCPIREDGVIVRLSSLAAAGDSVRTAGTLVRSAEGPYGIMTWAQGIVLVFGRVRDVWTLRGIRARAIT